jgi:hypothetical protein
MGHFLLANQQSRFTFAHGRSIVFAQPVTIPYLLLSYNS